MGGESTANKFWHVKEHVPFEHILFVIKWEMFFALVFR